MPFDLYSKLVPHASLNNSACIAETPSSYNFLTERHIQAMWLEQKYFKNLTTLDGTPIEVISPGIWNAEAGPDFLKAHLRIGTQEFRGDIELHLAEESWYHHRHHLDERYNQVVLHVSFWKPEKNTSILTLAGKPIIRTHLKNFLTISETRIVKLIDIDLYPYKHFVGSGQCARTLFNKLSDEKTLTLFRSASLWRLKKKWSHLTAKTDFQFDPFLAGFSMALGYKHNAEAFYELFCHLFTLHQNTQCDEKSLFAAALKRCGFFNEHYHQLWSDSPHYKALLPLLPADATSPIIKVRCDKVRPANHPVRRLAILSKLITNPIGEKLKLALVNVWDKNWHSKKWTKLRKELLEQIPIFFDSYWSYHYTFEKTPKTKEIALLGADLKREILINVCLPFLHDILEKRNNEHEKMAFETFFSQIPASNTRKATYLRQRFFGNTQRSSLLDRADTQQGAYQLHHDFCIHYEASCHGCPFIERYKKNSS